MLLIRTLEDDEVDRVAAVLGLARLYQGDGHYLVAWDGDEPVGHAYLALTDPPELQDVSVRETFRRRGVATALTAAAENEARGHGHVRLRVGVDERNDDARSLYTRNGYVDVGIPPKRVVGTIQIRPGPIEVDATLLTWEKILV